jgi:hypothetical protein
MNFAATLYENLTATPSTARPNSALFQTSPAQTWIVEEEEGDTYEVTHEVYFGENIRRAWHLAIKPLYLKLKARYLKSRAG